MTNYLNHVIFRFFIRKVCRTVTPVIYTGSAPGETVRVEKSEPPDLASLRRMSQREDHNFYLMFVDFSSLSLLMFCVGMLVWLVLL